MKNIQKQKPTQRRMIFWRCTIFRLAKPAFCRYLKKAGLASRNIVHLQKIILRCVRFCFYIFFIYMWSRLDHYWSNVYQQDHRSGCVLKIIETTWTIKSPYNSPPRVGIVKSVQVCAEITREIIRMSSTALETLWVTNLRLWKFLIN